MHPELPMVDMLLPAMDMALPQELPMVDMFLPAMDMALPQELPMLDMLLPAMGMAMHPELPMVDMLLPTLDMALSLQCLAMEPMRLLVMDMKYMIPSSNMVTRALMMRS